MRMKKLLAVLMTLAMIVSLLPATAFAANNTATTMRLAKTQGMVTVTNATGKNVSQTENMKLYNGYKIKTGAKSYAWVSLDDAKVAKLDANSAMEVQKSGQKLTLYLSSGNLFFNVKDPLPKGENFHIKTSTMTTGIRGTSGCVTVLNARVTEIDLLTGKLEIMAEHPVLGLKKTAVLLAGQSATSLIDWEAVAVSGEMAEIIIKALTADDVCGNCATEIAADPALLERIEKEAPQLLAEKIAAEADERLAADEAADAKKQKEIDDAAAKQTFPEEVDPLFEEEASGGGGGSAASSTPTTPSTPTDPPSPGAPSQPEDIVVSVDSWETTENGLGLKEQLEAANNGEVDEIDLTNSITVPAGENVVVDAGAKVTLNLGESTLTLGTDPDDVDKNSAIENNGELIITNEEGYINGSGNRAAIINYEGAVLEIKDSTIDGMGSNGVLNYGTFTMTGGDIGDSNGGRSVENKGTGEFIMEDGNITAPVLNFGDFTMTGGKITVGNEGIINAAGYDNGLKFGTFTMNGGQILNDSGDGTGIINEGGIVKLNSGAVLKDLDRAVSNHCATHELDEENEETLIGELTIDGATFDGISDIVIYNEGTVTQKAATIKNCTAYKYIDNYCGTVHLYGGDIHAEGMEYSVYNKSGVLNFNGGDYTIYGGTGIYNEGEYNYNEETGESSGQAIINMVDSSLTVLDGVGIWGSGGYIETDPEVVLMLNGGSIIAEGTAQGIVASENNTSLTLGNTFELKARSASRVSEIIPVDYVIVYVNEYWQLVPADSEEAKNTATGIEGAAEFVNAVMNCEDGGAITLNASITLNQDVLEEFGMTTGMDVTANSSKELNIDLNGKKLFLNIPMVNTGVLRFTDSSSEETGEIHVNEGGALENSGTLAVNEGYIYGTAAKLIENSGTLTLNKGSYVEVDVANGYGIYNTGELILDQGEGRGVTIEVYKGIGVYSGGENAKLTMKSGQVFAKEDAEMAMQFNGGTVSLLGGEIISHSGCVIKDNTSGGSAVEGTVDTYITVSVADIPTETVVANAYQGTLPDGYYMKYDEYDEYEGCLYLEEYSDAEEESETEEEPVAEEAETEEEPVAEETSETEEVEPEEEPVVEETSETEEAEPEEAEPEEAEPEETETEETSEAI